MRKPIVVALGSAAAAVLVVSGFAAAFASGGVAAAIDDGASPSVSASQSRSPSVSASPSDGATGGVDTVVTADDARAIATSVVPGGVVTEIDLRDGNTWKVHLNAPDGRYEVWIDATNGAVVKLERSGGVVTGSPSPTRGGDDDRGRNRGRGGDDGHDDDNSGRRGGDDDHEDDNSGRGRGRGGDD
jgi:hypothetical protein